MTRDKLLGILAMSLFLNLSVKAEQPEVPLERTAYTEIQSPPQVDHQEVATQLMDLILGCVYDKRPFSVDDTLVWCDTMEAPIMQMAESR